MQVGIHLDLMPRLSFVPFYISLVSDYVSVGGVLEFQPGNLSETVTLPITNDRIIEDTETFFVSVTSNNFNVMFDISTAIITVVDDDRKSPPMYHVSIDRFLLYNSKDIYIDPVYNIHTQQYQYILCVVVNGFPESRKDALMGAGLTISVSYVS